MGARLLTMLVLPAAVAGSDILMRGSGSTVQMNVRILRRNACALVAPAADSSAADACSRCSRTGGFTLHQLGLRELRVRSPSNLRHASSGEVRRRGQGRRVPRGSARDLPWSWDGGTVCSDALTNASKRHLLRVDGQQREVSRARSAQPHV